MTFDEAREQFIHSWGTLGSNWGINRTMAQIHALLLISPQPLCAEQIMEELNISRGNTNMNTRTLIDWGLVKKVFKPGERKEFFTAEKDIWTIARHIAKERKHRELDPIMNVMEQIKEVEEQPKREEELKEFVKVTSDISEFAAKAIRVVDKMERADRHWFYGKLLSLFK